jgi:2-iminobutanoate/2-iminopropanoate deaminase
VTRLLALALALALLPACALVVRDDDGDHDDHRMKLKHFPMPGDPEGKLPFADVVRAGNLLFQSGKVGLEPGTLKLVAGGIQPETRQTMELIKESFARHDVGMDRVVKCTVFLADMKEWAAMNEVYVQYFPDHKPARSALGASGLALGARVEIECIAAL